MRDVNALVLYGYGLNCDHESAYAFALAGARPERAHINALIAGGVRIENFQIMVFVGGFSWGDDHGAGVIQAVRMRTSIGEKIVAFIERGNLVIGICNGFQTLVNLGLLPGFDGDYQTRSVACAVNDCGTYRNDWVTLRANPESPCVFTRGIDRIDLPARHGEGKFTADSAIVERLIRNNQVAIRYAMADGTPADRKFPHNPNGSIDDIAGICDPTGRVFGLMPHPEAYNHWTNHPAWTREKEERKRRQEPFGSGLAPGIRLLKNGVDFMRVG
jgi:phosphoribosylformylglycinamidine synthase subunit PurQ / glutaminase